MGRIWNGIKNGFDIFSGPDKKDRSYLGGSPEALQALRFQAGAGIGRGNEYINQGIGYMSDAAAEAGQNRATAMDLYNRGAQLGVGSIGMQRAATNAAVQQASAPVSNAANVLLHQGLDQTRQAMAAQAADARGGNQAAAMRTAAATGSQMGLDAAQQAAMLRAQQEDARRNTIVAANQQAAQINNQAAGIGFGAQAQGLGYAADATGQTAGIGGNIGSLGLGSQGQYLGAQSDINTNQIGADTNWASAKQAGKGRALGFVANVFTGMGGMGGG